MPVKEFRDELFNQMDRLKVSRELASRYLNDGFSGGEKKRVEILQMAMLKPRMAVLDETDSGLDIDALKVVAEGIKRARRARAWARSSSPTTSGSSTTSSPTTSTSSSTAGSCESGGPELADRLEEFGYEEWGRGRRERSQNGSGGTHGSD